MAAGQGALMTSKFLSPVKLLGNGAFIGKAKREKGTIAYEPEINVACGLGARFAAFEIHVWKYSLPRIKLLPFRN